MKNDFTFLSSSACSQINKTQILIFGGTMESYSKKSRQSFLLEINFNREGKENHIAKGLNKFVLPYAEGFWNNVPIIYEGNLYCLQNIPNENNLNIVYNDRRKILKFNEREGWVCLN
jgi:histone acetyltransferase (RNA polymerase elongator complex component)